MLVSHFHHRLEAANLTFRVVMERGHTGLLLSRQASAQLLQLLFLPFLTRGAGKCSVGNILAA